jgi:hypothetical protein
VDWNNFGQQQDSPAQASEMWVDRVLATEANIHQQSGNAGSMLDALAKLFIFRQQNRRG